MSNVTQQDAEFARRWSAWQARGRVHEGAVRRRFSIAAIVVVVLGAALSLAYGLFPL
jgi:hypothetical protein